MSGRQAALVRDSPNLAGARGSTAPLPLPVPTASGSWCLMLAISVLGILWGGCWSEWALHFLHVAAGSDNSVTSICVAEICKAYSLLWVRWWSPFQLGIILCFYDSVILFQQCWTYLWVVEEGVSWGQHVSLCILVSCKPALCNLPPWPREVVDARWSFRSLPT